MNKDNLKNIIFETDDWVVALNEDQAYLGRSLVVLKRNCDAFSNIKEEEIIDFLNVVKKFEKALKKSFGAEMFNRTLLMNNTYKNNPPNPQVHWHVRPRYRNEVNFSGFKFKDPNFANHYNREAKRYIDEELSFKIIEKIKKNI